MIQHDERLALALAGRRFAEASREVVVMATHSLVGVEASHRIVPTDRVDDLITDSTSSPAPVSLSPRRARGSRSLRRYKRTERPGLRSAIH
jgi:DeoR/GlpR family transcriptional regulator of sugar metabolism